MSGTVRVEEVGRTAILWMDNPKKRNALDISLLRGLAEAARQLATREDPRVVVLRGGGGVFGAGADFDVLDVEDPAEQAARWQELEDCLDQAVQALACLPQPLVAALEGPCFGGAVQLALCADLRLASDTLRLAIPAASIGLIYPLHALRRLIDLLGPARTKMIVMTGRELSAGEAQAIGLVEEVAAADAFDGALAGTLKRLASYSALAVGGYKRIVDGLTDGVEIGRLRQEQHAINMSADTRERLTRALRARRSGKPTGPTR